MRRSNIEQTVFLARLTELAVYDRSKSCLSVCLSVCLCVNHAGCPISQPLHAETCNPASGYGHAPRTICWHFSGHFPVKKETYPPPENPTRAPSDIPQNTGDICPAKNPPSCHGTEHHSLFCIVTAAYSFQYWVPPVPLWKVGRIAVLNSVPLFTQNCVLCFQKAPSNR